MASGDTKTEALLNILGNGGDASEYKGCCNTKTQSYILDAIDRVQNVENEVEELKNNPDVVDIVDTYADLQAYDTSHLTDNDVIRVLTDETHSGNSTYYRFTKNPDTWTFVGEISGGASEVVHEITTDDYNWNKNLGSATEPYDTVAMWLLEPGWYSKADGSTVSLTKHANPGGIETISNGVFFIGETLGTSVNARVPYLLAYASDKTRWYQGFVRPDTGWEYDAGRILTNSDVNVVQTMGNSQTNVMSQNATTSMVFADAGTNQKVQVGNGATATGGSSVSIGRDSKAEAVSATAVGRNSDAKSQSSTAVGYYAKTNGEGSVAIGDNTVGGSSLSATRAVAVGSNASAGLKGSVALGAFSYAASVGEMNIGSYNHADYGYNGTQYRLLSGVYDAQGDHDAVTLGQLNGRVKQNAGAPTTTTAGTVGQLLEDTTNGKLYQCTAIDTTDPNNPSYTWSEVGAGGGGGPTVVQTTGTSQTDVMSQNAVTSMVFKDPTTKRIIQMGDGAIASQYASYSIAIGLNSNSTNNYGVALGAYAKTTRAGEVNIGSDTYSYGYNNTSYRVLGGVHDGQDIHDAATVAQGNTLATTAPDTSTVGVLGQLWTDTTNMHTYQCTAISGSTYTWTMRW